MTNSSGRESRLARVLLALVLASAPLTDATRAYADLEYEACVAKLAGLKGVPVGERAKAELLLGLCHFALGHDRQASAAIESALRRDASVAAPANASPKELAFIDAQRGKAKEPRQDKKRDAEPKPDEAVAIKREVEPKPREEGAPTPGAAVVQAPVSASDAGVTLAPVDAPLPAAVEAALPKTELVVAPKATWLPWVTGGVALAAAGVGTGLGVNAASLEAQGNGAPVQLDAARLAGDAQTSATGANIAFAVAGTAAITTVIAFIFTR